MEHLNEQPAQDFDALYKEYLHVRDQTEADRLKRVELISKMIEQADAIDQFTTIDSLVDNSVLKKRIAHRLAAWIESHPQAA